MVNLITKISFDISLERKRQPKPKPSKEITKTTSKVLRVISETIWTRLRKIT